MGDVEMYSAHYGGWVGAKITKVHSDGGVEVEAKIRKIVSQAEIRISTAYPLVGQDCERWSEHFKQWHKGTIKEICSDGMVVCETNISKTIPTSELEKHLRVPEDKQDDSYLRTEKPSPCLS